MLKSVLFGLLFFVFTHSVAQTVTDSTVQTQTKRSSAASLRYLLQDSVKFARAIEKQRIKDSITRAEDSLRQVRDALAMRYLKPLSSGSPNQFLDSIKQVYIQKEGAAWLWRKKSVDAMVKDIGKPKAYRKPWILTAVFSLFLFLGLIRIFFMKDLVAIATSFYSNRVLLQVSKEDNLITSWPFVFLYLLFGFTIGLFLYLYSYYYHFDTTYSGVNLFFMLSVIVLLLFTLKLLITRAIGYVFGIKRLIRDYISILYLSYFNAALIFLPLLLILSLVPDRTVHYWIWVSCGIVFLVFMMQFLRASNTVLKSYRFSKLYLFIYLCTLEVGPILILVKVLGK